MISTLDGCVISFTFRPLYPGGNSFQFPLDRKLNGPHGQTGCFEQGKVLLFLPGIKTQLQLS